TACALFRPWCGLPAPRSYPSFRPHPDGRAPAGVTDVAVRRPGKPCASPVSRLFTGPTGRRSSLPRGTAPGSPPKGPRAQARSTAEPDSPGRPVEPPTSQEVAVQVEDRLSPVTTGVEHQSITGIGDIVGKCHLVRLSLDLVDGPAGGNGRRGHVGVVGTRYDQHVRGCRRVDVPDGDGAVALAHDVGGHLPLDDLAEKAIGFGHRTPFRLCFAATTRTPRPPSGVAGAHHAATKSVACPRLTGVRRLVGRRSDREGCRE